MVAIMHRYPWYSRHRGGKLPRFHWCLRGWKLLTPERTRKVFLLSVWLSVAAKLGLAGRRLMGAFLQIMLCSYARLPVHVLALDLLHLLVPSTVGLLWIKRDVVPCHNSPLELRPIFLMCNISFSVGVAAPCSHLFQKQTHVDIWVAPIVVCWRCQLIIVGDAAVGEGPAEPTSSSCVRSTGSNSSCPCVESHREFKLQTRATV